MYSDNEYKFIAVLNSKIELPTLLNALAHCSAGLGNKLEKHQAQPNDYIDASGEIHPGISKFPWIILQARNSNQLRELRCQARSAGAEVTDFVHTMLGWSCDEQKEATRTMLEADLNYFVVCLYGRSELLRTFTKKFSLFRSPSPDFTYRAPVS
jgi:hypothetical protein